jgi:hypothetical protein
MHGVVAEAAMLEVMAAHQLFLFLTQHYKQAADIQVVAVVVVMSGPQDLAADNPVDN